MNNIIIILIISILIIFLYNKNQNNLEGFLLNNVVDNFDDSKNPDLSYYYLWGSPLRSKIHATLGKNNVVLRYDYKPPAYRGVYGCTFSK